MKKLLALVLLLCPAAFATTPVTGNMKDLGTNVVSKGSFVRFWLRGCGGNQPTVNGVAIIAPTSGGVYYFDFVPDATGAISGTLYSTRDSTGNSGGDITCGTSTLSVWYGMQAWLNGKSGPEIPVAAKNGVTLNISTVLPLSTTPVVPAPTGDSTYARLDAANLPFSGTVKAPNFIDSALTAGTSPICPNGTNGAFTTSGCVGGGGASNLGQLNGGNAPSGQTYNFSPATSVSLPLVGNGAVKPATSDAIQYVSTNGNDANDGESLGSAKLTPAAALAALPSTGSNQGGVAYMAAGTYVLTSTLTIGSATENVVIRPLGRIIIQCNITTGSKCIDIFPGSGFKCLMNEQNNCAIDTFGATTNVASLVDTDTTVQGQGLFLDGLVIRDSHAATVSTALLDYTNAFDAEHFGITIDPGPNETGLFIHDASATICPNADHFYALNIQGSFPEFSGKPLVIKDDLGCSIGPLDFNGFDISHPAAGNYNIEINGNGHNFGVFGSHFAGGYEEDSGANISTPAMNLVQDATNITFENVSQLRLNASASEYAYQITGAAAISGISIINDFVNGGATHNFVTNSISGVNDQDNLGSSYYYPGNQAGFGKFYFDGAPLISGNSATSFSGSWTSGNCLKAGASAGLISQNTVPCLGTGYSFPAQADGFTATFNHTFTANRSVSWPDFGGSVAIASGLFNLNDCVAVAAIDAGGLPEFGDGGACGSGGGSPGGTNTAVQFNNAAAFGGDATNFNYNSTTHALTISGAMHTQNNSFALAQLVDGSFQGDTICADNTLTWNDCIGGVGGRTVTTTSDTLVNGDRQQMVTYNSASPVAVSIASASSLGNNFTTYLRNINAGTVTITPSTSTINGGATATITEGEHCTLSSQDNTNYNLDCAIPLTAGANITITPGAFGASIASTGGSGGLSGMTAGQIPVAATATTVTSSKALAGTDSSIATTAGSLTNGALACGDANGGVTTTGCTSGTGPNELNLTSVTGNMTATTTPTNVTGISMSVLANTTYIGQCFLQASATSATTVQITWTGPASPTAVSFSGTLNASIGTSFGTLVNGTSSTTRQSQVGTFYLENGANAGTIQLQFQNSAAGTSTMYAGSYCIIHQKGAN